MRAMLDAQPSETRLLLLLILACLITFSARAIGFALTGEDALLARIGAGFVAAILFGIPAFYAVAGLTGLIARAFGGEASWRATRTAVFWSALATAPVVFATTLISAALATNSDAATAVGLAGSAWFGYAFCIAVATANKFRTAWGVFGVTLATLVVIFGAMWLLGGAI